MDIFKAVEDKLYDYVIEFFPDWRIKFAYDNAPELETPCLVIDIRSTSPTGREYTSTSMELDDQNKLYTTTQQSYQSIVRFEFVGKYDETLKTIPSGEMAQQLEFNLRTSAGYQSQAKNGLSLIGLDRIRRFPVKRETDTYLYYQLDVTFGFAVTETVEEDYIVDIGITGVYHDAGREPDHIIETTIDINP